MPEMSEIVVENMCLYDTGVMCNNSLIQSPISLPSPSQSRAPHQVHTMSTQPRKQTVKCVPSPRASSHHQHTPRNKCKVNNNKRKKQKQDMNEPMYPLSSNTQQTDKQTYVNVER